MPVITAIKQQQKYTNRYSIILDGRFAFSIGDLELLAEGLHSGMELSAERADQLRVQGEASKAYDQALGYLSLRQRSAYEVRTYLLGKEYGEETIEQIISRLTELKLLDDEAFARLWVENRQILKPRSKRVLQGELAQKGIAPEIANTVLADIDPNDQLDAIRALIQARGHRYDSQEKLMAYLARQGFAYDDIKKVLTLGEDL